MKPRIFLICALLSLAAASNIHNAVETEMFAVPVSPNLFNWTYQEFDQQYRFHAAMAGRPELPPWLRYIYSKRHHSGFIFGTPPRNTKSPLMLEVIGLNSADYETRRVQLTIEIRPKENLARHEVEFKIDNLNVEDLLDEHKMSRLKDILRMKLWTESGQDLYATFLASAIDLGARLPLKPSDGEGLVVRLGSAMPFSTELKRLREEVRPLSRLPSCPREFKRTTVERLFRDAEFTLDWCNFELYNTIYKDRGTEHLEYLTEIPNTSKSAKSIKSLDSRDVWTAPSLHSLPCRVYSKPLAATVAIPLLLFLVAVAALTAVLCFNYGAMPDPVSENFIQNIFHICIDYRNRRRAHKHDPVELCRYAAPNPEPTQQPDNGSTKSLGASPNNSLPRPYSPKSTTNLAASYNRPQPPPYSTNSLHNRRSTHDKTPTRSHTPDRNVLEESLKLLNEANITSEFDIIKDPILKDAILKDPILKDVLMNDPILKSPMLKNPIIDIADGAEDYVPIKASSDDYIPMKTDLDDINVPELTKYGLGGVAI